MTLQAFESTSTSVILSKDPYCMDIGFHWATTVTNQAISLWNAGTNVQEIADAIGTTRNSVIGKMQRLRNSGFAVNIRNADRIIDAKMLEAKKAQKLAKGESLIEVPVQIAEPIIVVESVTETVLETVGETIEEILIEVVPEEIEIESIEILFDEAVLQGVGYFDIRDGMCKYPLWGDDTPFADKRFCGEKIEGANKSWCTCHLEKVVDHSIKARSKIRLPRRI